MEKEKRKKRKKNFQRTMDAPKDSINFFKFLREAKDSKKREEETDSASEDEKNKEDSSYEGMEEIQKNAENVFVSYQDSSEAEKEDQEIADEEEEEEKYSCKGMEEILQDEDDDDNVLVSEQNSSDSDDVLEQEWVPGQGAAEEDEDDEEQSEDESQGEEEEDEGQDEDFEVRQMGQDVWWSKGTRKNKFKDRIRWLPVNSETFIYEPPKRGPVEGVTNYAIHHTTSILSTFHLYVTVEIYDIVVSMTNLQGQRVMPTWAPVDKLEMQAYFGLLLLAGVFKSRGENTLSLWGIDGRDIFPAVMSRKRFIHISRMLRFDDRETREARFQQDNDKLGPIREVWNIWISALQRMWAPRSEICVDEMLIGFRGRCPFRQYMPAKPDRYGLKVWVLCECETSYCWNLQFYLGKPSSTAKREEGLGKRVVMELTEGLTGTVTTDNFFTSHELGQQLLMRGMALVGTLRKRRQEIPPQLLDMRARRVLSTVFCFSQDTMICSYVPKKQKNVVLLSTKHRQPVVSDEAHKKPQVILDYNRCKGGVDNLDKVIGTYTCRRQTRRWPVAVLSRILDISAWNGFLVWTALNPGWEKNKKYRRRLFISMLGKELVYPHMARRTRLPQVDIARKRVMEARAFARQHPPALPQQAPPQPPAAPQPPAPPQPPAVRPLTRAAAKRAHDAATTAATAPTPPTRAAAVQARGLCRSCCKGKRAKTATSCTRCKEFLCKRCIQAIYCLKCST